MYVGSHVNMVGSYMTKHTPEFDGTFRVEIWDFDQIFVVPGQLVLKETD